MTLEEYYKPEETGWKILVPKDPSVWIISLMILCLVIGALFIGYYAGFNRGSYETNANCEDLLIYYNCIPVGYQYADFNNYEPNVQFDVQAMKDYGNTC